MRNCAFILMLIASFTLDGSSLAAGGEQSAQEQEFCSLDKNNDREISFDEFKACEFYKLEHVRMLPFAEPKDLGPGKQAALSDEELQNYLFRKADKNRDNKIDRKEWEEFYDSLREPGGGIGHGRLDRR